jgi:hypothetical protein
LGDGAGAEPGFGVEGEDLLYNVLFLRVGDQPVGVAVE